MLIENYKGIEINHNAAKDEFYTNIIIRKGSNGKKDEYITSPRLQRVRDDIDKFLNTAAKKPVLKKAWYKGKYESDAYKLVYVIIHNAISDTVVVQEKGGKPVSVALNDNGWRNDSKLFLSCKENDAIIANLIKKEAEISKIKKETSCSSGKLLPLKMEHFK
jgi:hypothetical protein